MPPNGFYSSSIDGSLYIASAKNAGRHGNGSALIENGVSLFGSADQYFQSTNAASDLIVDSKKVLKLAPVESTSVEISKAGINTKVQGSFNVDEASTLSGAVIASSTLGVSGVSTFASAVNAQSTLNVTGAVSASNNLTVDLLSTLKGAVTCQSSLAVTGASTFASSIDVTGASTFKELVTMDKDCGLMFKRNAQDSTAFWWDESDKTFVLATTDNSSSDSTLAVKELQKLKCASIEASSALLAPGFATTTVNLAGNSALPVAIPGVTAQRGSFEFIIESDNLDGSVFNYKIVKNKAGSDSPTLMGVHQEGDDGTLVWVKWDVINKAPEIYHKVTNASVTPITYKIKYLRVD